MPLKRCFRIAIIGVEELREAKLTSVERYRLSKIADEILRYLGTINEYSIYINDGDDGNRAAQLMNATFYVRNHLLVRVPIVGPTICKHNIKTLLSEPNLRDESVVIVVVPAENLDQILLDVGDDQSPRHETTHYFKVEVRKSWFKRPRVYLSRA